MRTTRCKGRNLLNHCRQKNIPKNIKIEYNFEKDRFDSEWECVLSFLDIKNKNKFLYASTRKTKFEALNAVLVLSEKDLLENLNTFKLNKNGSGERK